MKEHSKFILEPSFASLFHFKIYLISKTSDFILPFFKKKECCMFNICLLKIFFGIYSAVLPVLQLVKRISYRPTTRLKEDFLFY